MNNTSNINRRNFLRKASLLSASLLASRIMLATGKSDPVILFTSGWQDVNIGDIAHTPGLIALLKKRLPQAKLILWKRSSSAKVETMLNHYYPDVRIIHSQVNDNVPQAEEVKQAFQQADFFLHGSGPMVVAADYLEAWHAQTHKPFGLFGVTIQDVYPALKTLLASASLIFTRETASIEVLRKAGLSGSHIAFAPDATFALTIRDDDKAKAFLAANELKPRQFICAIPRLRMTPYYKINANSGWSDAKIKEVDTLNDTWKEADHAKLREAMIAWVRHTGNKVLVCPEMTYQVDIMDELLINPLPADVKAKVVRHLYWLPDEAAAVYAQAHTVLSFECHSPIMAAVNGTPCFYLRQPQDTIKGQMYYDLGLGDWTFEIEQTTGQQITDRLMEVTKNYKAAQQNVQKALSNVNDRYDKTFQLLRKTWL
ncbi:polysaccharide pyruvyl transferase family protein [Spirosoma sp. KNUC1025]|uniref:polysaccharide pyruvyl transferase family protein n=1 Tax=Spirosoma sp. KNUC1025 TaxID=2894082 RepID=UPI001E5E6743|nr:polysaccharide pyruvyl transferase family protein [Spirosoma sp. KNUC1025]UFH57962.1 polysaccharide pyruvyl transferase family protein [Spirosoma sp. KNUC1025]